LIAKSTVVQVSVPVNITVEIVHAGDDEFDIKTFERGIRNSLAKQLRSLDPYKRSIKAITFTQPAEHLS